MGGDCTKRKVFPLRNLPGITRIISISVYDQVQSLNYRAANQTALALLLFSFAVLAITYGLQRRGITIWPAR
jgi:molybdate transport system permease protein